MDCVPQMSNNHQCQYNLWSVNRTQPNTPNMDRWCLHKQRIGITVLLYPSIKWHKFTHKLNWNYTIHFRYRCTCFWGHESSPSQNMPTFLKPLRTFILIQLYHHPNLYSCTDRKSSRLTQKQASPKSLVQTNKKNLKTNTAPGQFVFNY